MKKGKIKSPDFNSDLDVVPHIFVKTPFRFPDQYSVNTISPTTYEFNLRKTFLIVFHLCIM